MSEADFESIDPHPLAEALRKARKDSGLTQADAAEIIGASRTTVTAIEKGERRVKADELIALSRAYGRQVGDLVRPRPAIESFRDRFKAVPHPLGPDDEGINASIDAFEEFCRNYIELEELTGSALLQDYPLPYDIAGLDPEAAAEDVSAAERNRLGLGEGPVPNLREVLEGDVGLRVFYLPLLSAEYAAIYLFNEVLGGCIAVNGRHSEERRRWSLAHQYGHFLAYRYRPAIILEDQYRRRPEREHFAESFAGYFLMPSSGLKRRFHGLLRANRTVTAADLGALAHYYGVSMATLTQRLEDLRLLPSGVWDRMTEGSYRVRETPRGYEVEPAVGPDDRLPVRYQYLAVSAYDQGLLSEGQLARFLATDRLEARGIAEELRGHARGVTDERPFELDLTRILID